MRALLIFGKEKTRQRAVASTAWHVRMALLAYQAYHELFAQVMSGQCFRLDAFW
jgi:hypothetical protein